MLASSGDSLLWEVRMLRSLEVELPPYIVEAQGTTPKRLQPAPDESGQSSSAKLAWSPLPPTRPTGAHVGGEAQTGGVIGRCKFTSCLEVPEDSLCSSCLAAGANFATHAGPVGGLGISSGSWPGGCGQIVLRFSSPLWFPGEFVGEPTTSMG